MLIKFDKILLLFICFHYIIYLQYNDGIALYTRIRFTKVFYQVLTLMGRKQQLQQNLSDCQRLLFNCSDMLDIMIATVTRGEKADEVCKCDACRKYYIFIFNYFCFLIFST
jgi:alpha-N-acetylglucosamine transferase